MMQLFERHLVTLSAHHKLGHAHDLVLAPFVDMLVFEVGRLPIGTLYVFVQ